jgi:two-component SAPR family response regulator
MDIHLADGYAFEIFNHTKITCPVIFTTAYDEYALQAFKVNSIDYLLKPITVEAVKKALDKLDQLLIQATFFGPPEGTYTTASAPGVSKKFSGTSQG